MEEDSNQHLQQPVIAQQTPPQACQPPPPQLTQTPPQVMPSYAPPQACQPPPPQLTQTPPQVIPSYASIIPHSGVPQTPTAAVYPAVISSNSGESSVIPTIQPMASAVQPVLIPNVGPAAYPQTVASMSNIANLQGMQKGVIYAFSQYSPFISIPTSGSNHYSHLSATDNEGSNLGPEDVAEVRKMTSAAAATSLQEHASRTYSGKCQSGGELRLSELSEKLNSLHIPDGFCLVGAKSPMLAGVTLVVVVDKRYLPGDSRAITMLGFSGNCIGCGATGFRYFTEFSTHINLKLATQPKKQKHLKYYIVKNQDGKWVRGPLIPWKGTETRKRSVPSHNIQMFGRTPELVPSFTKSGNQEREQAPPIFVSSILNDNESSPEFKKVRIDDEKKVIAAITTSVVTHTENGVFMKGADMNDLATKDTNPDFVFKLPASAICGVRPVLLLCQHNPCKMPSSVNDIIISDLLVDCFDTLAKSNHFDATTKTTYQTQSAAVMSTGSVSENSATNISNVEQNAANMLITMSGSTNPEQSLSQDSEAWIKYNDLTQKRDSNLPLNAAIILFTQYLCSLDDTCISKEQIELILNKANVDIQGSSNTAATPSASQIAYMIDLQCSASNGNVKLITSNNSFQNGLYKTLRWIHETFYMSTVSHKKLTIPNFVIILSTPPSGLVEFGVLVTGVSHAKILAECLGISSIVQSLNSKQHNSSTQFKEDLHRLSKQFLQTSEAIESLIKMFETSRENMVYVPFNAYAGMRVRHSQAKEYEPAIAPISANPPNTKGIFVNQAAMAQQLLSQLRNIAENPSVLDLPSFLKVELLIVVPPTISLYYLTVKRLCESGILNHLGLETEDVVANYEIGGKYVITYSDWPESISRWNSFVKNAKLNQDTLHLLIFDQAQRYSLPQGMPDVLPNLKDVFESCNVIPVFVTSTPYMFQTRKSFIDPDNEVYWTDGRRMHSSKNTDDKCVTNDHDMVYFGIKEFCDSTRWNQQFALIRHEETFDIAVPKANRLNDIKYSMVQGYVLLRLYQSSLMVAGGIKPAEPYAVMSVIRMVNDVVESPLHNADGSGFMLMIRIPDKRFGKYFHDVLLKTRNSIGFQYRFDLIYDDGDQELQISDYFLKRMRKWKVIRGWSEEKANAWRPRCLEDLLDLPCILILSGEERSGETFPRSLKYADFNILNHSSFHRSTIESEIGSVACYLSINAGTHSEIANKHVVMNNVRCGVGTTYLDTWKLKQIRGETVHQTVTEGVCKARCDGCLTKDSLKKHEDTCTHFSSKYPLPVLLVSKPLWNLLQSDKGLMLVHLNPDPNTQWIRSHRPLLTTTKPDRMSRHYRHWTNGRPVRKVLTTPGPKSGPPSPNEKNDEEINRLFTTAGRRRTEKTTGTDGSEDEHIDEHEDKDHEDKDKAKYHPRCLLLSGPPQAGKTGAYLHFAYILHRMLVRLKRVDVYDNCITYTPATIVHHSLPSLQNALTTKFVSGFLDSKYEHFSAAHVCSTVEQTLSQVVACTRENGTSDALVILSKSASYDTLHHCDMCRFYREGVQNTPVNTYSYVLNEFGKEKESIDLQIIIPPIHLKHFIIENETNVVTNLIVQPCEEQPKSDGIERNVVKTPILVISSGGEEEGLLNMHHSMEESDHIHITCIRASEVKQYQKHWPNHTFIVLPDQFNECSDSAIKNLLKAFATQNYLNEMERTTSKSGDLWPFVLIIPDNLVMWQKVGKAISECSSDSESETEDNTDRKRTTESGMSSLRDNTSLFDLLTTFERIPHLFSYGLIGVRPWSSYQEEAGLPYYLRTFVHSFLLLNVCATKDVFFSTHVFVGEDIDFQLKLIDEKIPICRFEHFTFMTKVTSRVSWRGIDEISVVESYRSLVVPPDMENQTVFSWNPHLVLQTYLSRAGSELFPMAVDKPDLPVLVIGPYLDLGSHVDVCVINCHGDMGSNDVIPSECTVNKTYAGLIVYNCSKRLPKSFLHQFQFVKDAQVVFICKERGELRAEVLRLDLEDSWRFRLRDEYQTATTNSLETSVKPLYFLTGSYVS